MNSNNTKRSKTYAEVTNKFSSPKEPNLQDKIYDKNKQSDKYKQNGCKSESNKTYDQIASSTSIENNKHTRPFKESNIGDNDNTKHEQISFEKADNEDEIFTKAIAIAELTSN